MSVDIKELERRIAAESTVTERILAETGKVIVGQRYMVERLLIGLLCDGHILLEGVPGLAKTLSVRTLAEVCDVSFARIQFTPDLLPADLVGTMIYDQRTGTFSPRLGPIFANFVLADEINRAPAKVQSALLESMQERQVTIGGTTHSLPDPFLVLATQNPIEQEGTYPLPEAQVDRFMLKLKIGYPNKSEERAILERMTGRELPVASTVVGREELLAARRLVKEVYVDAKIHNYIIDLVFATREPKAYGLPIEDLIEYGASPRASIYLAQAARGHAFLRGRGYVTPEDIKAIAHDVLRHRVILSYEAEAEDITADDVVQKVLDGIEAP
ncbi:AAA family ATPase [bacterium]|nr:AAA family ATPase [bacterium]